MLTVSLTNRGWGWNGIPARFQSLFLLICFSVSLSISVCLFHTHTNTHAHACMHTNTLAHPYQTYTTRLNPTPFNLVIVWLKHITHLYCLQRRFKIYIRHEKYGNKYFNDDVNIKQNSIKIAHNKQSISRYLMMVLVLVVVVVWWWW